MEAPAFGYGAGDPNCRGDTNSWEYTVNVAVLGLGHMGRAIAGRLVDAGHHLVVWNRTPGRAGELTNRGVRESESVVDAVQGADVVLTSLTGDTAAREVLSPNAAAVSGLTAVVVDCSTVAPATSRALADYYPDRFVAAPLAGAPQAVIDGQALVIVGGAPGAVAVADPVLTAISATRRDAGADPGTAALIKLLNNYLLIGGLALLADVVSTAQANGFDDADLADLLGQLPVVAPALTNRIDGLLGADHEGWFAIDLGAKDLGLFREIATESGAELGLADSVVARYEAAARQGLGGLDLTAVIEPLRNAIG